MSKLSICFAGLSRQEEAEVVSLFKQANAQAGNHWVVAPETFAARRRTRTTGWKRTCASMRKREPSISCWWISRGSPSAGVSTASARIQPLGDFKAQVARDDRHEAAGDAIAAIVAVAIAIAAEPSPIADAVVEATAATCTYTVPYTAVLESGNVYGVQFHPEKSGPLGLQIVANFLRL